MEAPEHLPVEGLERGLVGLPRGHEAEADDGQLGLGQQLEPGFVADPVLQATGEGEVPTDRGPDPGGPQLAEQRPHHHPPRRRGQLHAPVGVVRAHAVEDGLGRLGGEGPFEVLGRALGEGPLQQIGVPHERGADPDGGRQPFVGVDDGRVGPSQSGEPRGQFGQAGGEQAVGPVDVEPHVGLSGKVGQRVEGIDRPRVGRARRTHDGHGHEAGLPVSGDGPGDGVDVHPLAVIDRDGVDTVPAQTEDGGRPGNGVVGFHRGVDPTRSVDPVGRGVDAPGLVRGLAGGPETDEVGHRAAGRKEALVAGRHPQERLQPLQGQSLEVGRGGQQVAMGAGGGRRQVGQHARGRRSVLDPAREPRLADPRSVGDDEPTQLVQHPVHPHALFGHGPIEGGHPDVPFGAHRTGLLPAPDLLQMGQQPGDGLGQSSGLRRVAHRRRLGPPRNLAVRSGAAVR